MYQIYADGNLIYQPANENLRLISPKLTVEMGKAGGLNFGIPPTNNYYGNLQQLKALLTVEEDGAEIFRGRVLSNTRNFNNVRNIYGEGDLSYLVDSVQLPKKYKGKAKELLMQIIDNHNAMIQGSVSLSDGGYAPLVDRDDPTLYASWQPGPKQFKVGVISDELKDIDVYIAGKDEDITDKETNKFDYNQIVINGEVDNWKTTFDFIENSLIDYAGGYLRTRYENSITYIDWYKEYYKESNQTISFGKNLLDLTEENNAEDAFSVLIPIGDENLTITKASDDTGDENVTKFDRELIYKPALEKYGRIVKTNVFDGVSKAETLKENGIRYLKEHAIPPITFTITAVDMHLLNPNVESIRVGDKVHILSAPHELDDPDLICTKIEYDLTNPANTKYTFGKPKQSLTERYRQDRKPKQGGGGGGKAAKDAEDSANANTREIYDAWVKWDQEHATIDIGALFEKLNPGLDKTQIHSKAQILMGANADGSNIDLISEFNSSIDNISNQAGVTINTGADRPELIIYVNDTTTGTSANINLGIDYNKTVEEDANGNTHVKYEPKSKIALTADVVEFVTNEFKVHADLFEVEAKLIKLGKVLTVGDVVTISSSLHTSGLRVTGSSVFENNGRGVEFFVHHHKLTCDALGKVTLGDVVIGTTENSFNMADTQFYKEHVSASLKLTYDHNDVSATAEAKNYYGSVVLTKKVYNMDQPTDCDVYFKALTDGKHFEVRGKPKNMAGNLITKPDGTLDYKTITIEDSTAYNKGASSVTISSVNIEKNYVAGKLYSVTATAKASNGTTKSKTITI